MNSNRDFSSNSIQSQILFPETIPPPHNVSKFSPSALKMYVSEYSMARLIGCKPKKAHNAAMAQIRKTHVLRSGQWVLPS